MEEIVSLLSNLAFPVAMCIILIQRDSKQDEQHREETKGFTDAINNLNQSMVAMFTWLKAILTGGGDDDEN